MPRTARASAGDVCYHVLNRGNGRNAVFHKHADYEAFLRLLDDACSRLPMRVLAFCLMPNHFHLVVWPRRPGDLSRWMQWLLTAHVRRYHAHYHGSGHVWQGRFKAFAIQKDEHLLTALRYTERNPVRANLVESAEDWPWSSVHWWTGGELPSYADEGPVRRGKNWPAWVNKALTESELDRVRNSIRRGSPYGDERWQKRIARRLGVEASLRPRGRPKKIQNK